jgi:hypothetical protein
VPAEGVSAFPQPVGPPGPRADRRRLDDRHRPARPGPRDGRHPEPGPGARGLGPAVRRPPGRRVPAGSGRAGPTAGGPAGPDRESRSGDSNRLEIPSSPVTLKLPDFPESHNRYKPCNLRILGFVFVNPLVASTARFGKLGIIGKVCAALASFAHFPQSVCGYFHFIQSAQPAEFAQLWLRLRTFRVR